MLIHKHELIFCCFPVFPPLLPAQGRATPTAASGRPTTTVPLPHLSRAAPPSRLPSAATPQKEAGGRSPDCERGGAGHAGFWEAGHGRLQRQEGAAKAGTCVVGGRSRLGCSLSLKPSYIIFKKIFISSSSSSPPPSFLLPEKQHRNTRRAARPQLPSSAPVGKVGGKSSRPSGCDRRCWRRSNDEKPRPY